MDWSAPKMTAHLDALFGPVKSVVDRPLWQVLKVSKYLYEQDTLSALTQRQMVEAK